ncbi:MAG: agmatinase [Sagittula sp.]|jgi:agmatinase|uniref:agmatinase n=1 Tax=unclassified Sagittula TaxID=2624628 RepID=UPI000C2CF184|nr:MULTISPECIES: agmatinase [unclassified Sagittula]AUC51908.1 agmatinase [Sagittula sp. P11]WHZ36908.1 agmatinase [Sagittula sp. MA-2]
MSLEEAKTQIDHAFTREDLKGPSFENVFAGAPSFLRRKYTKDLTGVDVAVTGLPFDQAVTNRPGARLGPRAIREASLLQTMDKPYGWDFDVLSECAIADYGDMALDYAMPSEVPARVEAHVSGILDAGAACVALGGDHSVTWGCLRAHAKKHGPLSVIQFDAHTDTWADDDFNRVDHGTFMYKAAKEGIVVPERSVQIGIRTDNPDTLGFNIIDAREVHEIGAEQVAQRVHEIVGQAPCYLTFDIDALDPAFAPGTGTPVWGGLSSHQAAVILRRLAGLDLKGGDVVEVSPPFDTTGATAVAAAHVATEILCLWGWRRRKAVSG